MNPIRTSTSIPAVALCRSARAGGLRQGGAAARRFVGHAGDDLVAAGDDRVLCRRHRPARPR